MKSTSLLFACTALLVEGKTKHRDAADMFCHNFTGTASDLSLVASTAVAEAHHADLVSGCNSGDPDGLDSCVRGARMIFQHESTFCKDSVPKATYDEWRTNNCQRDAFKQNAARHTCPTKLAVGHPDYGKARRSWLGH